jgi:EARP and GARP complex-interacting protein 1
MKCTLWSFDDKPEMTIAGDDSTHYSLKRSSDIPIGNVTNALWEPNTSASRIICIADNQFYLIDSSESSPKVVSNANLDSKGQPKFTNLRWNPHHSYTQIATCNDSSLRGWDLRSMKQSYLIENAHGQMVRDLDFNSNKQYYLVSCGDDCKVKFWDIRKTNECLKVLSEHSHWIWSVRYNNFHDQLVLSCSSDTRVILSSVASLSSEPFGSNSIDDDNDNIKDDSQQRVPLEDRLIKVYEEHEDSVYKTEWAASDPWIFASLSYDGRFVINKVPKADKFKIIL